MARSIPKRFRDPRKQHIYVMARRRHERLMAGLNGHANAYRRGFLDPDQPWPKNWVTYPIWRAGVDNRKEAGA